MGRRCQSQSRATRRDVGEPEPRQPPLVARRSASAHGTREAGPDHARRTVGPAAASRARSSSLGASISPDAASASGRSRCSRRSTASIHDSKTAGDASGWNCTPHAMRREPGRLDRAVRRRRQATRTRRAAARPRRGSTGSTAAPRRNGRQQVVGRPSSVSADRRQADRLAVRVDDDLAAERDRGELVAQADAEERPVRSATVRRSAPWSACSQACWSSSFAPISPPSTTSAS